MILVALVFLTGCSLIATPENINVQIDKPIIVQEGEDFEIKLTIENAGSKDRILDSIDYDTAFGEGIFIYGSEPMSVEEGDVWGLSYMEYHMDFPAYSTMEMTLMAKALKPGDYSTTLGVCIDKDTTCVDKIIRIIVE